MSSSPRPFEAGDPVVCLQDIPAGLLTTGGAFDSRPFLLEGTTGILVGDAEWGFAVHFERVQDTAGDIVSAWVPFKEEYFGHLGMTRC